MNPWHERYIAKLDRFLSPRNGRPRRVLDVGCGDGMMSARVPYSRVLVGVDVIPNPGSANGAGMVVARADATMLPFRAGSFDLVVAKDALHHIENPAAAMAEIHRVAAEGARIVIIESNRWNPIGYVHLVWRGGHGHFSRRKLDRIVDPWMQSPQVWAIETHVYPLSYWSFSAPLRVYEFMMERTPLLRSLCSYFVVAGRRRS